MLYVMLCIPVLYITVLCITVLSAHLMHQTRQTPNFRFSIFLSVTIIIQIPLGKLGKLGKFQGNTHLIIPTR